VKALKFQRSYITGTGLAGSIKGGDGSYIKQIVHLYPFLWMFSCACSSDPSKCKGYLKTVSHLWFQCTELGCVCKSRRQWVASKITQISPVRNASLLCPHGTSFAHSNIPSVALGGRVVDDEEVGAATDDRFRM
jgi:hypothetical protein